MVIVPVLSGVSALSPEGKAYIVRDGIHAMGKFTSIYLFFEIRIRIGLDTPCPVLKHGISRFVSW